MNGALHSVTDAAGSQAARLLPLWRFMLIVSAVVFVVVVAGLIVALVRGRRSTSPPPDRRLLGWVGAAAAVTMVTLFGYLGFNFAVGHAMTGPPSGALVIDLVGHQWWWEVEYDDSLPQRHLRTANEIHIPVGRPVLLRLEAADVIHSIWVPSLAGKKDLIPGHPNSLLIRADRAGVYRGQCAEFCGHQHALMGLLVIAEPPAQFAAWYRSQLEPAAQPADSAARRGEQVFLGGSCAMCHAVEGTPAASHEGPPLTHLASRRTLAAATLPNTRAGLGAWIVDPQGTKPGVHMPPNELAPADLNALLDYLRGLR